MDFEKFTERSKGFIQNAQTLALRNNNQQLLPEHLLKVLLDDEEGLAANLISAAGGDAAQARARTEAACNAIPKVEGSGASQMYMAQETARVLDLSLIHI